MKRAASLLILLTTIVFSCQNKATVDVLIADAEVIDVESGEVLSNQYIGIRNDTIVFIGDSDTGYKANTTIEASGKYVIPGLWDMHVHFRGGKKLIEENKNLIPLFMANGITGVREAGGDMTEEIFKWRKAIQNEEMVGPKIFTSGPKLDGPGGTWAGSIPVTTKEEAVQAVDSLINMEVNFTI